MEIYFSSGVDYSRGEYYSRNAQFGWSAGTRPEDIRNMSGDTVAISEVSHGTSKERIPADKGKHMPRKQSMQLDQAGLLLVLRKFKMLWFVPPKQLMSMRNNRTAIVDLDY